MPLSSGMIDVRGPTAGANDLIASSRSNALQLSKTTSNFSLNLSACNAGGSFSVTSPFGLLITRPASASSTARLGRTRKVTSRPACSILPPKYPPIAPAPTTRIRIAEFLLLFVLEAANRNGEWRMANREISIRYSPFANRVLLPLFAERADFELKGPGAAWLLVKLPIGRCNRRRRHQQVRIVERFLAPELLPALAHPGGVDAGIDDQMRDMDVLRPEFARHRLRHRPQAELGAGKGRKAATAAQARGRASEEDVALAPRQHQPRRFAPGDEACPAGHFPDLAEDAVGGLQNGKADVGADIEDADLQRRMLVGVIEERRHLVRLARVERARDDRSARGLDIPNQRLELGAVATPGEYGESLGGEFLGDFGADIIAGADHRDGCVAFFHSGFSTRPDEPTRPPRNDGKSLTRNQLLDLAQLLLAEKHFLADEEGRRAEGAAFDRRLRVLDQLRLDVPFLRAGEQFCCVEAGCRERFHRHFGIVHFFRLAPHVMKRGIDIFLKHALELGCDRGAH